MDIKPMDCYLPVDTVSLKTFIATNTTYGGDAPIEIAWLELHTNMIVMSKEEYLADKKKTAEGWISVGDRLPEEKKDGLGGYSENVNVTDGKDVWLSCWWESINQWSGDEDKITHWQPLPSPPTSTPFK